MPKKVHATKKVFLSLAVIAASGGYVAFENANPQANSGNGLAGSNGNVVLKAATPSLTLGLDANAAEAPRRAAPAASPTPTNTQAEPAQSPDPAATASIAAPATDDHLFAAASPQPDVTDQSGSDAATAPAPVNPSAGLPAQNAPADAGQTWQQGDIAQSGSTVTLPLYAPLPEPRPDYTPGTTNSMRVAQAGFRNGTFRGPSENAYYGQVQLAAVIQSGQISRIRVLDHPNDFRRSRYINSVALPILEREAVRAQDANIDIVSGATLTSVAFIRSLSAARSAAKG